MIAVLLLATLGAAQSWEPVEWPPPAPGVFTGPPPGPPASGAVERLYAWYHDRISPRDGARCPFQPTCSAYALGAFQAHGPALGLLLTVDRLLREYPWMRNDRFYPLVAPHGVGRFHDPVPP